MSNTRNHVSPFSANTLLLGGQGAIVATMNNPFAVTDPRWWLVVTLFAFVGGLIGASWGHAGVTR